MSIDWSKAGAGFDFHFQAKRKHDVGGFYRVSRTNDRFETKSGSYILFRDFPELADLFVINSRPVLTDWTGEGLPPVGTTCEYGTGNSWGECTVLHVGSLYMLIAANGREEVPIYHSSFCFRPIRTAQQIAAEERKAAIEELISGHDNETLRAWAAYVYDALGYRKA